MPFFCPILIDKKDETLLKILFSEIYCEYVLLFEWEKQSGKFIGQYPFYILSRRFGLKGLHKFILGPTTG